MIQIKLTSDDDFVYNFEQKLLSMEQEDINISKQPILGCIKHMLTKVATTELLSDDALLVADKVNKCIKKLLSFSRDITEGEIIEDLLITLCILAAFVNESKSCTLAQTIFKSISIQNGHEAFFLLLKTNLYNISVGDLEMNLQLSDWQLGKIFKAVYRWMSKNINSFAMAGLSYEVLHDLTQVDFGPHIIVKE